jgi:hypothetical protein
MGVMRWLAGILLLAGCRIGFDELGGGGTAGDGSSGDGNGSASSDSGELGAFGAPMQHTVLGSMRDDQGPSPTGDLLEIYFYSNRSCPSCYDLFVATRASVLEPWGAPIVITQLSSASVDASPEVSADGLTVWFASERDTPSGGSDIWVSTRADRASSWGIPTREPNLSTAGYDTDPSLSDDGLMMTLTSDGSGDVLGDILVSTRPSLGAPWSVPVPLAELNTTVLESAGSVRDGAHVIFFARQAGEFDIYVSTRELTSGPFGAAVLLDNINSAQIDFDAWVSHDLRTLYFSSERTGTMEIFEATR